MKKMPKWLKAALITLISLGAVVGIIYGVLIYIRSSSSAVNVYSVSDVQMYYSGVNQSETQGQVKADRMQSVYVSSTQLVTEVYVKEGDTVKAGDPILSYDTTLTDLQLKRQEIQVQQLELQIKSAENNLALINTYKIYDPNAQPEVKKLTPVPSLPYWRNADADGTKEHPYIMVWDDSVVFTESFVNTYLGTYTEETVEAPVFYLICEYRDQNSLEGNVISNRMLVFTRLADGGYDFYITAAPEYDLANPPEDEPDTNVYVTYAELVALRKSANEQISSLKMDLKKAELEYRTLEHELTGGLVTSTIDGVVMTVNDPEAVSGTSDPAVLVSGGGGYYVTGALSETELDSMHVGDTVSCMSWESYMSYTAVITEISEFPLSDSSNTYHYSEGNQNASLYAFTARIETDSAMREGEYLYITYTPGGDEGSGMYIQSMFIRSENGQSYVLKKGEDGKLVRANVKTGRDLWGSYTEILSGIDENDFIAFPYGRNVKEGAAAVESDINALYTY